MHRVQCPFIHSHSCYIDSAQPQLDEDIFSFFLFVCSREAALVSQVSVQNCKPQLIYTEAVMDSAAGGRHEAPAAGPACKIHINASHCHCKCSKSPNKNSPNKNSSSCRRRTWQASPKTGSVQFTKFCRHTNTFQPINTIKKSSNLPHRSRLVKAEIQVSPCHVFPVLFWSLVLLSSHS